MFNTIVLYYIAGSNNKNILNYINVKIVTNIPLYVTSMIYGNAILPTWVRLEVAVNEGLTGPRVRETSHDEGLLQVRVIHCLRTHTTLMIRQ